MLSYKLFIGLMRVAQLAASSSHIASPRHADGGVDASLLQLPAEGEHFRVRGALVGVFIDGIVWNKVHLAQQPLE